MALIILILKMHLRVYSKGTGMMQCFMLGVFFLVCGKNVVRLFTIDYYEESCRPQLAGKNHGTHILISLHHLTEGISIHFGFTKCGVQDLVFSCCGKGLPVPFIVGDMANKDSGMDASSTMTASVAFRSRR